MYTYSRYITMAEYQQIAAAIERQFAAEKRMRKQRPPLVEVFECALVSALVADGDYG